VGGVWVGAVEDGTHIRAGAGLAQQQINEGHGCLLFGIGVQDNGWWLMANRIYKEKCLCLLIGIGCLLCI
jgi:hypothetical protein